MHFGFIRNGIVVAIIAHGLIGATLVWDKVLLRQPETRNLFSYVFWLGFISIFGLALAPFGFQMPKAPVVALAFGAGLLHMAALISIPLLRNPIGGRAVLAGFLLLVAGGFVMFISEKTDIAKVLPSVLLASVSYGLVNVLQKLA